MSKKEFISEKYDYCTKDINSEVTDANFNFIVGKDENRIEIDSRLLKILKFLKGKGLPVTITDYTIEMENKSDSLFNIINEKGLLQIYFLSDLLLTVDLATGVLLLEQDSESTFEFVKHGEYVEVYLNLRNVTGMKYKELIIRTKLAANEDINSAVIRVVRYHEPWLYWFE